MRKFIIIGILIAFTFQASAKGKWITGLGSSFGYNTKELQLWKYKVNSTHSIGMYFSFGYELYLGKRFSVSFTPGIHQHHDIVELNDTEVSGYSYNYDIPLEIQYRFLSKWSVHSGIAIQDYRAIKDVALNKSYNARLNLNLGLIHHFNQRWAMELSYSRIISEQVDSFLFRNYTNHISLGVLVNPQFFKKRNHD